MALIQDRKAIQHRVSLCISYNSHNVTLKQIHIYMALYAQIIYLSNIYLILADLPLLLRFAYNMYKNIRCMFEIDCYSNSSQIYF